MTSQQSRIVGGLYGLLVGDALGVPYEFKSPSNIPPLEQIEFEPPHGYPRAHQVPAGTWSDDGAQALALLDSLLSCGKLDLDDLMTRFVAWHSDGKYAVEGVVFDIGITTSQAISNFRRGTPARDAGLSGEYDNGNGSLMRVLPLALWHQGDDRQLAKDAMWQSMVTHGHARSQACCALYCLWARYLLRDDPNAWENASATLRSLVKGTPYEAEIESHIRPDELTPGNGSGYVVDSLRSARWVMQEPTYEGVVKAAVAMGNDTDTTACIAGGLAGIRDGAEAIPPRWLEALRGRDLADELLARLSERSS